MKGLLFDTLTSVVYAATQLNAKYANANDSSDQAVHARTLSSGTPNLSEKRPWKQWYDHVV